MNIRSLVTGSPRLVGCIALLGASTLIGCGSLTPGGFGEASVSVTGDAPNPAAKALSASTVAALASPARSAHEDEEAEGEVEAKFALFLISADGAATRLGEEELEVRVDVRGESEAEVVQDQMVPAVLYTGFRIVFKEIKAEIDAGLIINGVPVTGEIRVEFEDLTLEVERALNLDVAAGTRASLTVDLNALSWLQAVDPDTGIVDPTVFASLIEVTIQ